MKRTRGRKTIEVAYVRNRVNAILANGNATQDMKKGVALMLESILQKTGNYNGYNYTAWLNGGCEKWRKETGGGSANTSAYLGKEYDRIYY